MNYFQECIQRQIAADQERCEAGGWEFRPRDVDCHTIGDLLGAVLAVDTAEHAKMFYEGCVAAIQHQIDAASWGSPCTAEEGARADIGWCFGEGMAPERITMWHEVCGAFHPIFGVTLPTPEDAVAAGYNRGLAATAKSELGQGDEGI